MLAKKLSSYPLQGVPTERVLRIRDRMLSNPFELDLERARCYTRMWKLYEDSPPCLRKARSLEEFLKCLPIRIDDDEDQHRDGRVEAHVLATAGDAHGHREHDAHTGGQPG